MQAASGKPSELDTVSKIKELSKENTRLGDLVTKCQEKAHTSGLEKKELEDRIVKLVNEVTH